MNSKIRRVVVIIGLLTVMLPAAAAPVAAETGPCVNGAPFVRHYGNKYTAGNLHVTEVRAWIDIGGEFYPCANNGVDGPFIAVGIEPDPASGNGIVAVGVLSAQAGVRQYYWEASGCGYSNAGIITSLGNAPGTNVHYRVAQFSTQVVMYIDEADGTGWHQVKSVPDTDLALACWIDGNTQGSWLASTFDGGDSLGSASNNTRQTDAQYTVSGGSLSPVDWNAGTCLIMSADAPIMTNYCTRYNGGIITSGYEDSFYVYTTSP